MEAYAVACMRHGLAQGAGGWRPQRRLQRLCSGVTYCTVSRSYRSTSGLKNGTVASWRLLCGAMCPCPAGDSGGSKDRIGKGGTTTSQPSAAGSIYPEAGQTAAGGGGGRVRVCVSRDGEGRGGAVLGSEVTCTEGRLRDLAVVLHRWRCVLMCGEGEGGATSLPHTHTAGSPRPFPSPYGYPCQALWGLCGTASATATRRRPGSGEEVLMADNGCGRMLTGLPCPIEPNANGDLRKQVAADGTGAPPPRAGAVYDN